MTAQGWPWEGARIQVLFPAGRSEFVLVDEWGAEWRYSCDAQGRALVQPQHVEQLVEEGCVLDTRR